MAESPDRMDDCLKARDVSLCEWDENLAVSGWMKKTGDGKKNGR